MKKTILITGLALVMSISSLFANTGEGINKKIINSFKKEFVDAKDVQWEKSKNLVKATFNLNEQILFAYFSAEGKLLAVSRNITSTQLPINLLTEVKKNYSKYWITDLFEIAMDNEVSYYMTLECSDYSLVLKSGGSNGWEVYKKDKKEME